MTDYCENVECSHELCELILVFPSEPRASRHGEEKQNGYCGYQWISAILGIALPEVLRLSRLINCHFRYRKSASSYRRNLPQASQ